MLTLGRFSSIVLRLSTRLCTSSSLHSLQSRQEFLRPQLQEEIVLNRPSNHKPDSFQPVNQIVPKLRLKFLDKPKYYQKHRKIEPGSWRELLYTADLNRSKRTSQLNSYHTKTVVKVKQATLQSLQGFHSNGTSEQQDPTFSRLPEEKLVTIFPNDPIGQAFEKTRLDLQCPTPSLLEALFPEEIAELRNVVVENGSKEQQVPRIPLPEFKGESNSGQYDLAHEGRQKRALGTAASKDAFRKWNLAVLAMSQASKSLDETDFRLIAPQGHHIEDWCGPGDFLKVFPGRDRSTLEQTRHYLLLFPNPAYARAYQGRVSALHRIARTYAPKSIESPIPPPPGMLLEGEDIHTVLQKYTLCPPTQKLSLKGLFAPYSANVKRLLDRRGYSQIIHPHDKTYKSVLLRITGRHLGLISIRNMIRRDGKERGIAWSLLNFQKPVDVVDSSVLSVDDQVGPNQAADTKRLPNKPTLRYIVNFTEEDEARRFVRAWHRRPFPAEEGSEETYTGYKPSQIIYAEVLW